MRNTLHTSFQTEEKLVAELAHLDVGYLSRENLDSSYPQHTPPELLMQLIRQPSSRVRSAIIALLLAHPDFSRYVSQALTGLDHENAQRLRFLYTAAVYLQEQYAGTLQPYLGARWGILPDLFSKELGITGDSPSARLKKLANLHAQWSGEDLNWVGTYENAAKLLVRRWESEQRWKT